MTSRLVWRSGTKGTIPSDAVPGGYQGPGYEPTYIGRVHNIGGRDQVMPGPIVPAHRKCYIPSINATGYTCYDILTNPARVPLRWVAASGGELPLGAVLAGHEDGGPLYVGRASHRSGDLCIGKVFPPDRVIYYPFEGGELHASHYEVLVEDAPVGKLPSGLEQRFARIELDEDKIRFTRVSEDGRNTYNIFIEKVVIHKYPC